MKLTTLLNKDTYTPDTQRALISGILGGLAGTAVKSIVEHYLPVRKVEQRSAQIKILDDLSTKITGGPISVENEALAEQLVNFPVGASVGAAYGYGKKDKDELKVFDGVILGSTTWFTTHETSLPLMGLEENPKDIPIKTQANELFAHVMFGITTELVRSFVSKKLKNR
ncbi:MAG TPA: DUF1440 domain-containing protein [Salegentibacter sp.]|uniref:DUF1440 domain-containing protein n=1 Tax=Salegentibacter sp. TaxID=1903072 RepID=UPI002F91E41D